jgi:hypothetical protein
MLWDNECLLARSAAAAAAAAKKIAMGHLPADNAGQTQEISQMGLR